jgi:hypothetical protein
MAPSHEKTRNAADGFLASLLPVLLFCLYRPDQKDQRITNHQLAA